MAKEHKPNYLKDYIFFCNKHINDYLNILNLSSPLGKKNNKQTPAVNTELFTIPIENNSFIYLCPIKVSRPLYLIHPW